METDDAFIKSANDHEYSMAKLASEDRNRRRAATTERVQAVAWVVGIVAVLAIATTWIYLWQKDAGDRGIRIEQACVDSGGTWTSLGGGSKMCVRIEQRP
jgi:hypothetical protein